MSGFRDFTDFVSELPKQLPIAGVTYDFPARVSAETGLVLLTIQSAVRDAGGPDVGLEQLGVTAEQVITAQTEMLGDAHAALVAAGHAGAVGHVIATLSAWHLSGQAAAEAMWNSLGPTPPPNRQARRATARSTTSRASTAGTTASPEPKRPAQD